MKSQLKTPFCPTKNVIESLQNNICPTQNVIESLKTTSFFPTDLGDFRQDLLPMEPLWDILLPLISLAVGTSLGALGMQITLGMTFVPT